MFDGGGAPKGHFWEIIHPFFPFPRLYREPEKVIDYSLMSHPQIFKLSHLQIILEFWCLKFVYC